MSVVVDMPQIFPPAQIRSLYFLLKKLQRIKKLIQVCEIQELRANKIPIKRKNSVDELTHGFTLEILFFYLLLYTFFTFIYKLDKIFIFKQPPRAEQILFYF